MPALEHDIVKPNIGSQAKAIRHEAAIGFSGNVHNSYIHHPNNEQVIYSLGATLIVQNIKHRSHQAVLSGHRNPITCLAVSPSGRYIATGEEVYGNSKAEILLWDFESKQLIQRFPLHKIRVQDLAFSAGDKFLVSLGGVEDNQLILWDLEKKAAISGHTAAKETSGAVSFVAFFNKDTYKFVTGGDQILRTWEIEKSSLKLKPTDCRLGTMKRVFTCAQVLSSDKLFYCGTTTGDFVEINADTGLLVRSGPKKTGDMFSLGVTCLLLSHDERRLIVGTGSGHVALVDRESFKQEAYEKLEGKVTSLNIYTNGAVYAGTSKSNVYSLENLSLRSSLISTAHPNKVTDICFPAKSSELFITSSVGEIRIWNIHHKELLRIQERDETCLCLGLKKDGKSIISGWSDGKIRAYGPESGRNQFVINDAHHGAVTALAATAEDQEGAYRLITGGADGQIRVWNISKQKQTLLQTMKEHKGAVTKVHIRRNDKECVSSSADGSTIIWELNAQKCTRLQILFAATNFKAVTYIPDESQLLTCGTDGKIAYWETYSGALIREIESNPPVTFNCITTTADGKYIIVGGSDKLVKIYQYEQGQLAFVGKGHSAEVAGLRVTPDQKKLVSVSTDGAIFVWKMPVE